MYPQCLNFYFKFLSIEPTDNNFFSFMFVFYLEPETSLNNMASFMNDLASATPRSVYFIS